MPSDHDVTVFVGAAGGDGTTMATILAATAARDQGRRVTIIDPRGDVAVLGGVPRQRRKGLSASSLRLHNCALDHDQSASLVEVAEGIVLLSQDADTAQLATGDRVGAVGPWLDDVVAARAELGDKVLVDAGAAIDAGANGWLELVGPADRVLVASNRPASIVRAGELLRRGVAHRSLLVLDFRFSAWTGEVCAAWDRQPDAVIVGSESLTDAAELGTLLDGASPSDALPLQLIVGRSAPERTHSGGVSLG